MREQINILKYGFLFFLIVVGVVSIFYEELSFVNAINTLSIPIFAFSLSILLVKANQYARQEILKKITNQNKIVENLHNNIIQEEEKIKGIEYKNKQELEKKLSLMYEKSLISSKELTFYYKFFFTIDLFTRIFNIIAMLSFSGCLLSLTGIVKINTNFAWVNIFSLVLVFFDFFVFEDLIKKSFNKKIEKISKKATKTVAKDMQNNEE